MAGSSVSLNKTIVILTPGFASDESDTSCIPALQDYVLALQQSFPGLRIVVLAFQYPYKWDGTGGMESMYFLPAGKTKNLFPG